MVVGNGLVATLFKSVDKEDTIFFASGVSNSLERNEANFRREYDLLLKHVKESKYKKFVYFSTCSIYDSTKAESPYVLHKLKMERLIADHCKDYLILRVSNVVGQGGNRALLMNYLTHAVEMDEIIDVHIDATRNIIDAEDLKSITLAVLSKTNHIINVAYIFNYKIIEILRVIESHYDKKIKINLIKEGTHYHIDTRMVQDYFVKNGLNDKDRYLEKILAKYYPVKS